ncbi:MAG: hypothetical protein JJE09_02580 [Bacteroidia bacterium]|nr:hypothetical protein [Bacteroidia bacterium]
MKREAKCHITLLMLFVVSGAFAQSSQKGINLGDHILIKMSEKDLYGNTDKKVDGSPYLDDAFYDGEVHTVKGKYTGVPMRYDIYKDQFEFKQSNKMYILDPGLQLIKISIEKREFIVCKYDLKGKEQFGFFERLDSGKLTLMSRKLMAFREAQEPKALESTSTPAKYSRQPDVYFYMIGVGEISKIESISKLIASLPDKQDELAKFAKKEKISARKENDLIQFVKFYNSLLPNR